MDPIDFHSKKKLLWKSMGSIYCLVTDILQNIFLIVQQEIHTGLKQLDDRIVKKCVILQCGSLFGCL